MGTCDDYVSQYEWIISRWGTKCYTTESGFYIYEHEVVSSEMWDVQTRVVLCDDEGDK